jgi:hypothetical protein
MPSLSTRLIALIIGVAFALAAAAPSDAKTRRHPQKKPVVAHRAKVVAPRCRGENLFPCGPVYIGDEYLGDDPDPFIRSQILRDLGAHFGGESD